MTLREDAQELLGELTELRHALHREPEIGLDLPKTQRTVLNAIEDLDLEISTGKALSSITAVLRGARPGPTVLLRGDMDALPMVEETGLDFASTTGDTMHSCGHDLHTAMLVGAAKLLHARKNDLAGNIVFMFQPGEERDDGAAKMIDEGVLLASGEKPVAAYGMHVSSNQLPRGMFAAKSGPLMAACDTVHGKVIGQGGHGSQPHTTHDPIPVLCEIILALQAMQTRRFDPFDPTVLSIGRIAAGTADNIIPDVAEFDATIRTFAEHTRDQMQDYVTRVCENVAAAHGAKVELDYLREYPVTVNNDAETAFLAETIRDVFGADSYFDLPTPLAGSEDFSRILNEVPGAFVFLGASPSEDPFSAPSNHSPLATFDDSVMPAGAALHAELALRRLAR